MSSGRFSGTREPRLLGVHMKVPEPTVLVPNENLWKLLRALNPKMFTRDVREVGPLVGIDPGETTGVAKWVPTLKDRAEIHLWQLTTKDIGQSFDLLEALLLADPPRHVRYEDYRIYHWLAESQAWSQLHTVRLIGAMAVLFHQHSIPNSEMLAQQPKAFWTDEKLKATGTYKPGMRHARDAVRHLLYYGSFNL
jgi:hypothetical protein